MSARESGRFSIVPASAVEDSRLSHAAFRVLACLGTYADKQGWCWPSTRVLAERLGVTRSTVSEHVQQLIRFGYLESHPRRRPDGSMTSNAYRLMFDRPEIPELDDDGVSAQPTASVGNSDTAKMAGNKGVGSADIVENGRNKGCRLSRYPLSAQPYTPPVQNRHHERPTIKKKKHTDADAPDDAVSFDKFWDEYPPRRTHSNPKKPARAKFDAAVRNGVDPAAIIRGAKNYARYVQREGTDARYTAQAMTWLNQDRWEQYQQESTSNGNAAKARGNFL